MSRSLHRQQPGLLKHLEIHRWPKAAAKAAKAVKAAKIKVIAEKTMVTVAKIMLEVVNERQEERSFLMGRWDIKILICCDCNCGRIQHHMMRLIFRRT